MRKKFTTYISLLLLIIGFKYNSYSQGNDPCSAVALSVNPGAVCPTFTSGTTVGQTYSNTAPNGGTPTCAVPGRPDVWYSIIVPASGRVVVTTNTGTLTDAGMSIYSSSNNLCSGTLTQLACDDDSGPGLMPQLTGCVLPGTTRLFIRIWSRGGFFGDPFVTGTFTICAYDPYVQNTSSNTNCAGGTQVCSNNSFTGNNSGLGVAELTPCNRGCLIGNEHNSSWYWLNIGTTGTLQMTISPTNGTDDYDFALWGPISVCPPNSAPIRCSWAATGGNTGMGNGALDNSENDFGDRWVAPANVTAGQTYILLVDGFTPASQPFNLTWGGTSSLSCTPIVLPIELLNFSGKPYGKQNIIEWTTATEINNDFFTIEKSENGADFSILSTVKGAGMSNETKHYSTIDNNPFNGITYYRLKQTDYNGKFSYSEIITVENKSGGFSVTNIHPNPTNKDFSFDFYSPINGMVKMQVLDYTGRVVLNDLVSVSEGKTTLSAEIGNLASGIYSLKVVFEQTGFTAVNMLIKQ
jgi:hypothetical protein